MLVCKRRSGLVLVVPHKFLRLLAERNAEAGGLRRIREVKLEGAGKQVAGGDRSPQQSKSSRTHSLQLRAFSFVSFFLLAGRILVGSRSIGSKQEAGVAASPLELMTVRRLVYENVKQLLDRGCRIPGVSVLVPFHVVEVVLGSHVVRHE